MQILSGDLFVRVHLFFPVYFLLTEVPEISGYFDHVFLTSSVFSFPLQAHILCCDMSLLVVSIMHLHNECC